MTSSLKRFTLAAALAAASAFPALAGSIKVGFNAPLTGFAAADGNSALIGAQLAVEQVNAAGGVNGEMLELLVYDDQASPKESAPLAVKMITQDEVAAGISGSYSGSTRAAATIFQENATPYISAYAVHPDITRAGDYVFRTSFMGEVQGRAGAKLIGGLMNLKRVVVITLNNDFGKSLAAGFKETAASSASTSPASTRTRSRIANSARSSRRSRRTRRTRSTPRGISSRPGRWCASSGRRGSRSR